MRDNGGVNEQTQQVSVRRAPKIGAFLAVGAALGFIVTLVLTSAFPVDPQVGFGATFGYLLLYGIPAGIVLGGVVALALDRRSRRRARTVGVAHESVEPPVEGSRSDRLETGSHEG